MKRRANAPGELQKGTPFIITSNLSPQNLLNNLNARILKARALSINCSGVTLFNLINIIRATHGLDPFEPVLDIVPQDLE